MLEPGQVLRFFYLWKREADAGEESGRKARPVCFVVRSPINADVIFLFPITSQEPPPDTIALAVSQFECRRAGLATPCWIIIEEYNRVDLGQAFDFEATKPIGAFSPAFLNKIALTVKEAGARRRLSGVVRS